MEDNSFFYPILGYVGHYEINRNGEVRSVSRPYMMDNGVVRYSGSVILKQQVNKAGYYYVSLSVEGKPNRFNVHRLISINFIPNPMKLPVVNHIDGNKLNNNISNLEWCSISHNCKHTYKLGFLAPGRKLSFDEVKDIFYNTKYDSLMYSREGTLTVEQMAKKHCVHKSTIQCIVKKQKYLEMVSTFDDIPVIRKVNKHPTRIRTENNYVFPKVTTDETDEDYIFYPMKGWEGFFEINKIGVIKSLGRFVNSQWGENSIYKQPKIMTPSEYKDQKYFYVNLCANGITKKIKIHRILAEMFVPNPENKPQVNHIDGNRQNNHLSNLEWTTASENSQNSFARGRVIHNRKLDEEKLRDIFNNVRSNSIERFKNGTYSIKEMAEKYNVSPGAIRSAMNGTKYQTITSKFI